MNNNTKVATVFHELISICKDTAALYFLLMLPIRRALLSCHLMLVSFCASIERQKTKKSPLHNYNTGALFNTILAQERMQLWHLWEVRWTDTSQKTFPLSFIASMFSQTTTEVIRLSNVYSLLSFYPSNSPLVHTEQPCFISAKAMQGSPHRGSAHSPLKSVQSEL